MKVKNGDIVAAKPALEAALQLPADKLSVKGKYHLAKLGRALSGPLSDVEATRIKLVHQHGVKTEQGYTVSAAKLADFQADLTEVLEIENDVEWTEITLSPKDAEALTGEQIMLLDRFIVIPEPVDEVQASSNGKEDEAKGKSLKMVK